MLLKSEKKTAPTQLLMFWEGRTKFEGTNKDTFKGKTHQYLFTVFSIID